MREASPTLARALTLQTYLAARASHVARATESHVRFKINAQSLVALIGERPRAFLATATFTADKALRTGVCALTAVISIPPPVNAASFAGKGSLSHAFFRAAPATAYLSAIASAAAHATILRIRCQVDAVSAAFVGTESAASIRASAATTDLSFFAGTPAGPAVFEGTTCVDTTLPTTEEPARTRAKASPVIANVPLFADASTCSAVGKTHARIDAGVAAHFLIRRAVRRHRL